MAILKVGKLPVCRLEIQGFAFRENRKTPTPSLLKNLWATCYNKNLSEDFERLTAFFHGELPG
jgi:hypothetical protein